MLCGKVQKKIQISRPIYSKIFKFPAQFLNEEI